jgi:CheY-like chemotaxis protein
MVQMDRTVVVVDDEPDVLDLVCEVLELRGYTLVCLEQPPQPDAVRAQVTDPSLFLIDIMLPGTTGIEVARGLRDHGYVYTPMVAMSASRGHLRAARESGLFQDILSKPFDVHRLVEVVERQVRSEVGDSSS